MADGYLAANPDQDGDAPQKRDRNDAAFAWLTAWLDARGIRLDTATLAEGILTDGYLTGAASAAAVVAGGKADLGGWQPGDADAARAQAGVLGAGDALTAFLAAQAAEAAQRISGGILAALSRVLAGTDGDAPHGQLAASLKQAAADTALAAGLVFAEVCTAVARAAKAIYQALAPTVVFSWQTDPTLENCAICLGNEAAEPRPLGDPWPSGDTDTDIHPKCGCALIPA